MDGCPRGRYEDNVFRILGKSSVRTGNIGGIQGGRRPETGECPKLTGVHRSSGGDEHRCLNEPGADLGLLAGGLSQS